MLQAPHGFAWPTFSQSGPHWVPESRTFVDSLNIDFDKTLISSIKVQSLSVLTAVFPGEPGLAGFAGAKDDGSGGDNWSCKAPVKSSPPTNQHPAFHRPDVLSVAQPTVSQH